MQETVRKILARHGRSFWLASFFLPVSIRSDITTLYAFFRTLDNFADDPQYPEPIARSLLLSWRTWVLFDFRPPPPDPALATLVASVFQRYHLNPNYTVELIDCLLDDLRPRRLTTFAELLHYCYGVGGTVGLTLAPLLGVQCRRGLEAAKTLGLAMQLTNIARDVGEDLRRHRLYLPQEDLSRFRVSESSLRALATEFAPPPQEVRLLIRLQTERARLLYDRAQHGYTCLPRPVRFGILSAAELYRSILTALERNRFDSLRLRAVTGADDKILAILRAWRLHQSLERDRRKPCPTCL